MSSTSSSLIVRRSRRSVRSGDGNSYGRRTSGTGGERYGAFHPRVPTTKAAFRTALGVWVGLLQGFLRPYATVGLDSGGGIRTRDLRVMRCRTGGQVGSSCRSLREISWVREGVVLSNWNHIGTTDVTRSRWPPWD